MSEQKNIPCTQKVIKVDEELCTKIEALAFEVEARRATIVSCIDTGVQLTNKVFKSYEEEYTKFFVLYQHAKRELETKYIAPLYSNLAGVRWNLQYSTRELTITAMNPAINGGCACDAAKN